MAESVGFPRILTIKEPTLLSPSSNLLDLTRHGAGQDCPDVVRRKTRCTDGYFPFNGLTMIE